jgi:predicted PurR-regulated permease PerM
MATISEERTNDEACDEQPRDLATRERLLLFVLMFVTAVVAYLSFLLIQPFLPAIIWALALTIVARPVHRWLRSKVTHPGAAAGLGVLFVAVCILAPVFFVAQHTTKQALATVEWIRSEEKISEWKAMLENHPRLAPAVEWAEENFDVAGEAQQVVGNLTSSMTSWLTGTIWLGMQLLIMLLTLFFFFRDGGRIMGTVRSLIPLSHREANKVFRSVDDTVHATVFGTVTVAMVQGAMGAIIFAIMGIPGALLWGVIMGLLSIIPYLGAFVIWGPVAAYLALSGDWTKAIILTAYGVLAIGLIDNLLYPLLVGKRMRLHTLAAFFAILGGVAVFGMSGVVIGPVVVAVGLALVDIWRQRTAEGQGAENPT